MIYPKRMNPISDSYDATCNVLCTCNGTTTLLTALNIQLVELFDQDISSNTTSPAAILSLFWRDIPVDKICTPSSITIQHTAREGGCLSRSCLDAKTAMDRCGQAAMGPSRSEWRFDG